MFNSNRCYQLGSLVLAAIQKGGKLFIKRNPTNRILRVCYWILKGNYKAKLGRSGWIQQNYEIEIHGPSGENVNEKKNNRKEMNYSDESLVEFGNCWKRRGEMQRRERGAVSDSERREQGISRDRNYNSFGVPFWKYCILLGRF